MAPPANAQPVGSKPAATVTSSATAPTAKSATAPSAKKQPPPASPAKDADAVDVQKAFALGWQVAQLFHEPFHGGDTGVPTKIDDRLPGLSGLHPAERDVLLAMQIGALVDSLLHAPTTSAGGAGSDPVSKPVAEPVSKPASAAPLVEAVRDPDRTKETVAKAVWELHFDLLEALTVKNFRLGKAYGLGRALAETVMYPTSGAIADASRGAAYAEMFDPGRIATINAWLQQLKGDFPPHASYAVHGSLQRWMEWVGKSRQALDAPIARAQKRVDEAQSNVLKLVAAMGPESGKVKAAQESLSKHETSLRKAIKAADDAEKKLKESKPSATPFNLFDDTLAIDDCLRAQGKLWRGMLSGEVVPTDVLDAGSYIAGSAAMMARLKDLIGRFLAQYWVIVVAAFVVVAVVVALLALLPSYDATNKIVTEIAAVAAALGLSVKGVTSTLGRTIASAEAPLWQSELDESCAVAATRLPASVPIKRSEKAVVGRII